MTYPPLYPLYEGQFDTFDQWVNRAQMWLTGDPRGNAICVDTKGRRCSFGKDFMRARDEDCFPIRFFWEMTTTPPEAECPTTPEPD